MKLFELRVALIMEHHLLKENDWWGIVIYTWIYNIFQKQIKWVYHLKENNCQYVLSMGNLYTTLQASIASNT